MSTAPTSVPTDAAAASAREAGLRYVSDSDPGIARKRAGKGFSYVDPQGRRVRDVVTLDRIRMLAIPPAYTDVWICSTPRGHLQATGRDARKRKQYRYHADWSTTRGDGKFTRVIAFGSALPKLRRRLRADLKLRGWPQDKVLALVVSLMAETLVRIGNDSYAKENRSFGLTTLRGRHVDFVRGGRVRFHFRGKGGAEHDIEVGDAKLSKLVRDCQQLPGQTLFQYRDDAGGVRPVDSGMVNDYLRDAMGEDFTAKDFRTWGGTLQAVRNLAETPLPEARGDRPPAERAYVALQNDVIRVVADKLGNTVAVCRKAYIDPLVFESWRAGVLHTATRGMRGARQWESATLKVLKRARKANRKANRKAAPRRAGKRAA